MEYLKCFESDHYLGNLNSYRYLHLFKTVANEMYVVIDGEGRNVPKLLVGQEALDYYKLITKKEYSNENN